MFWLFLLFLIGADAFMPFRDGRGEDLLAKLRDEKETLSTRTIESNKPEKESIEAENTDKIPMTTKKPVTEEEVTEEEEKEEKEVISTTTEKEEQKTTSTTPEVETTTTSSAPARCKDQFSRCFSVSFLCTNKLYEKIMITSCAKTCGFCHDFVRIPAPERCRDQYPEECKTWGDNGFCHAYFYTMPEKIENCMKTCSLC